MSPVTRKPVITAANRFPVMNLSIFCNLLPAAFWIPLLMIFMPKRKSPRLPTMFKQVMKIMHILFKNAGIPAGKETFR